MRLVTIIALVTALAGFGWVFSLPSKSECLASGRVVDPTERHCESSSGFVQLEEHALFHSREAVVAGVVLLAIVYAVQRHVRRRAMASSLGPPS